MRAGESARDGALTPEPAVVSQPLTDAIDGCLDVNRRFFVLLCIQNRLTDRLGVG